MKGLLIFILGAVIGAAGSFLFGTGIGAGAGVITGLKAGACLTVEAAKDKGLITGDQVDEVLNAAVQSILSQEASGEAAITEADLKCEQVVAEMKAAAKSAQ